LDEIVFYVIFVARTECAADTERIVSDANVELAFVDTGGASFYDEFFFGLVYVNG
jgi:hypothetical protein